MPKMKRLLLIEQHLGDSAPSKTILKALESQSVQCDLISLRDIENTTRWIRLVARSDAILLVAYSEISNFTIRQFAISAILGKPLLRYWVGTDVLNNITNARITESSQKLDSLVSMNLATGNHLAEELASVQIESEQVKLVLPGFDFKMTPEDTELPLSCLCYLPSSRWDFYGGEHVKKLVRDNPDIVFHIVADHDGRLSHYPNVINHGWVKDLQRLWPHVGVLLRMTDHDGIPRMVLEALMQRKHVLYSWPLDGCILVKTSSEAHQALRSFQRSRQPNEYGRQAAHLLVNEESPHALHEQIASSKVNLGILAEAVKQILSHYWNRLYKNT